MNSLFQLLDSIKIPGLGSIGLLLLVILLFPALGYLAFNILVIRTFFSELFDFLKEVFKALIPAKWDSAKTLIWVSLFSWAMSMLAGAIVQNLIAIVGWLFLIPGVHWIMYEEKSLKTLLTVNKLFLGPWVTGALICFFLFATPQSIPPVAFVAWPCISAVIATLPKCIFPGPTYKLPAVKDRQDLVLMVLTNLLLSCWIQLSFSTQTWLTQYPSLLADNLRNSSFVVQMQPPSDVRSRGVDVLQRADADLKDALDNQPWPQVERWLLDFDKHIEEMNGSVRNRLPRMAENSFWQLKGRVLAGEYNVQLYAVWRGPTADALGYYLSKTCQISKGVTQSVVTIPNPSVTPTPRSTSALDNASVRCNPVEGPMRGEPASQTR